MPRGAIAKRSAKPGAPGPPGPSGLGVLAFPDIATMAAFPTAAYVDGVDSHVLSLDETWSYDPTSTLAPDVTAYAPLGITIVSANGPGNWTRRQATSRRWRDRASWFIDPVNGDDEASGLTVPTALGTFAELMRRLEGLPAGASGYDVEILSDLTEAVVIDSNQISGAGALYIHADPILLFAGTITSHVDYDDSVPRAGTITCAGLPVSWTASGLVGKLVRMPGGGGATAIEFWIMQDMGAKTARISPPQAGVFTTAVATVTNTAFEVYDLVQFGSTLSVLDTGGMGAQVDFETLELGGAAADPHAVEFKRGGALVESCSVHGVDTSGSAAPIFYNCQFPSDLRADGGARVIVANGYVPPGGGGPTARAGSILDFTRTISYNGWLVQQNGLSRCVAVDGWLGSLGIVGLGTAFTVEGGGLLALSRNGPGRIWALDMGAGSVGLNVLADGTCIFDNAKPMLFTAPATQVILGAALSKTIAQMPYTDPITQARVLNATPPDVAEDYFARVAADVNTVSAVPVNLISQAIVVNGLRDVLIDATWSLTLAAGTLAGLQIFIDGVFVVGSGASTFGIGAQIISGSMRWKASLAAGAHTIDLRWFVNAGVGQVFCQPVGGGGFEHADLTIRELYG